MHRYINIYTLILQSFVNRMCDQISTKGPIAPLFSSTLDLFTCTGILGFHFSVHQSKVRGARPSVEIILCTDFLEGWVSPT